MYRQFNIQQLYALPTLYLLGMCFVFIWEQRATCATYSINWLVFITEMKSVYSAVRTGSLNTVQPARSYSKCSAGAPKFTSQCIPLLPPPLYNLKSSAQKPPPPTPERYQNSPPTFNSLLRPHTPTVNLPPHYIRKVLRPVISTQVFLGFPVPKSKCWDGSQDSKLALHASHVALLT